MKKGQSAIIGIILLIVFIIILIWFLFIYAPSFTGQAVKEIDKIVCNSPYIRVGSSCCLDKDNNKICDKEETINQDYLSSICTISAPFGCDEFSIYKTGITLIIRNGMGEDIVVKKVSISDCGVASGLKIINDGSTETFSIACSLNQGTNFKGDIAITYQKVSSAVDLITTGTIAGEVR